MTKTHFYCDICGERIRDDELARAMRYEATGSFYPVDLMYPEDSYQRERATSWSEHHAHEDCFEKVINSMRDVSEPPEWTPDGSVSRRKSRW